MCFSKVSHQNSSNLRPRQQKLDKAMKIMENVKDDIAVTLTGANREDYEDVYQ